MEQDLCSYWNIGVATRAEYYLLEVEPAHIPCAEGHPVMVVGYRETVGDKLGGTPMDYMVVGWAIAEWYLGCHWYWETGGGSHKEWSLDYMYVVVGWVIAE